jgi:hypothetical protein
MKSYNHVKDPKLLKWWNSHVSRMITQLLKWSHLCASRTMAQQHICGDDKSCGHEDSSWNLNNDAQYK